MEQLIHKKLVALDRNVKSICRYLVLLSVVQLEYREANRKIGKEVVSPASLKVEREDGFAGELKYPKTIPALSKNVTVDRP